MGWVVRGVVLVVAVVMCRMLKYINKYTNIAYIEIDPWSVYTFVKHKSIITISCRKSDKGVR